MAQAKLNPKFSERIAEPGDTVELDVGEGSEQFLGPLRMFLVSLQGADRFQVNIGDMGTPGKFGAPRTLRFEVPDVHAGDYTVAIWFKGYETGTWANVLEGINPLLTIGAADESAASPAQSDGQSRWPFWALAITVGGLGADLSHRVATRRLPRGYGVSVS